MTAHFPQNPLHVANMAQRMAENTRGIDSVVFQKVATISMGVLAVASVVQVLTSLLRELNRKHDDGRGHGRGR